ncbi:MAG TPA: hypothetical protein VIK72_16890 [Clostridiaceae bacterium]
MRNMIKTLSISLCFLLLILFRTSIAYASTNLDKPFEKHYISDSIKAELSALLVKENLSEKISRDIPSDTNNFTLSPPIKLYKLINQGPNFINEYNNKNNMTTYISNYYSIIQCIKSSSGRVLGTIYYDRIDENDLKNVDFWYDPSDKANFLKRYKAIGNTWHISWIDQGSFSPADYFGDLVGLQKKLSNVDINKINDIFLLQSDSNIPAMVYVQTPAGEYIQSQGFHELTKKHYKVSHEKWWNFQ